MESKKNKFILDKVLVVAVVVGMFALALADNLLSSKSDVNSCDIVAKNIAQNSLGINH